MDKISVKEKAKRYDEAIERARKIKNGEPINVPDGTLVPDAIFPELAESEGERIRKELIEQVVYIVPNDDEVDSEGNVLPTYQKRIDKYLAWLEKQGEHQEYPKDVIDNAISFLANRNDGMPEKEAKDIVNAIITILNPSYWPKQGEQKIQRCGVSCFTDIVQAIRTVYNKESAYDLTDYLTELANKKEQKPAEWSEEDEIYISDVLWCVEQARKVAKDENDMGTTWCAERWLKSLKGRYTWKPSDEQIDALESTTENCAYSEYQDCLRELIEQLKKLIKE